MSWAEFRTLEYDEASPRPPVFDDEPAGLRSTTVSPAFGDALVAQLPALRRYAVALVGNAALADDLVQDSIERALGQGAQLREPERLAAWLRRILHNLYIDRIRRDRRRGRERDITE